MVRTKLGSLEDLLTELEKDGYKTFRERYSKYGFISGETNALSLVNRIIGTTYMKKSYEKKIIAFLRNNYKKYDTFDKAFDAAIIS